MQALKNLTKAIFILTILHFGNLLRANDLVEFNSSEGIKRFERSKWKVDFFSLANQFEAQSNGLFCGPTTAAIILNAKTLDTSTAPKDRSRLEAFNLEFLPKDFDPSVSRHTQETVVQKSNKDLDVVFGKPIIVNDKSTQDFGYQLKQFEALLIANGLKAKATVANDKISDKEILKIFKENLKKPGDYILVNYKRSEVGQKGGGHISPLVAYDPESNSFLVMDVNPSKAKWVWMKFDTLVKGLRSFDTIDNRGFIVVE